MKNFLALFLTISTFLNAQTSRSVDVCVYGGTSAGVMAAYTAKMNGKSVLLIEPGKHLGGLTTGGLGYTDIGNKYAVTGISRDFYRRIGQHYGKFEQWIFEPHVAEDLFMEYIKKANVEVLFDRRLVSVAKSQTTITKIVVENSAGSNLTINAKMFIDCTYEGDLMAKAGVSYIVGREANTDFNETYNGFQLRNKHQFPDGIDPYKVKGQPSSGLLWGISAAPAQAEGTGDNQVQAYNFRICLSNEPSNRIGITQPDDYQSDRYELLLRFIEKQPAKSLGLFLKMDLMPNHKTDINNNGPFSTDMIGMNYDYPEATYEKRKTIIKSHEDYVKGLLYFIGHDERMPQHLREEMLTWGYPKDEYTDNGNWSPQAYIREARRMKGDYVMTQANCESKTIVTDGVGMAAYTMDSHNVQRLVVDGMVKNEGDVQIGGFPPYPISYRSLIPKASECTNLFVPVCLSATHIAYGSIRMEPVFMVLAQSSAEAAVMAIDKKTTVQQVDVKKLQEKLKRDPLANGSVAEIMIDNDETSLLKTVGSWSLVKNARGCYGPSLLTLDASKPGTALFSPKIVKAGLYSIYVYVPKMDEGASHVTVIVSDGKNSKEVVMNTKDLKVEGQTSGEWINIGDHRLPAGQSAGLTITNKNANGLVTADAVLFVPVRER